MSPWVGVSSASSSRMNVDLPEPDGPIRKTNSPLSILTEMLSSAGRADDLYSFVTWSRVIIGYLRRGSPWLQPAEKTPLLLSVTCRWWRLRCHGGPISAPFPLLARRRELQLH